MEGVAVVFAEREDWVAVVDHNYRCYYDGRLCSLRAGIALRTVWSGPCRSYICANVLTETMDHRLWQRNEVKKWLELAWIGL